MGDSPHNVKIMAPEKDEKEAPAASKQPATPRSQADSQPDIGAPDNRPAHSQYSSPAPQHRHDPGRLPLQPSHTMYGMSPHGQPAPFNMTQMGAALPDYASHHSQQYPGTMQQPGPHHGAGAATPAIVYQLQQQVQYPPTAGYPASAYAGYPPQPQYAPAYGQPPPSPQSGYGSYPQAQQRGAMHPQAHPYSQNPMPYYYYPDAYGRPGGPPVQYSPQPQYQSGSRAGIGSEHKIGRRQSGSHMYGGQYLGEEAAMRQYPEQQSSTAIPRGPPRKPKQSGHALWVGNLPPGATIMALKDHFSRDFTREIESLFLISKSNCAFVNYRTEDACTRAMQQFHDSRFEGVRLVCRLRKGSAATAGAPTGPAAMTGIPSPSHSQTHSQTHSQPQSQTQSRSSSKEDIAEDTVEADGVDEMDGVEPGHESDRADLVDGHSPPPKESERFFIVKSLTLQDLEQSVRNGIWATQSHNETALNAAFESCDNVYLIFSANKSGEYFGFAKMASTIAENAAEIFGTIPRTEVSETADVPRTIPTPATEFAPRGHIIDDSARGTIFWEAEFTDDEAEEEAVEPSEIESEPQTWGKPFKIEWMSTARVPFYRTRGLRNPWNANREVKIARDGTELEPNVGKRLIQLFHRSSPAQ